MDFRSLSRSVKATLLVLAALIVVGAFLLWLGVFQNRGVNPQYEQLGITNGPPIPTPFGVITAKDDSSITIASQFGPRTYRLTQQTIVTSMGESKSVSDIEVGAIVSITKSTGGIFSEETAKEIQIIPPPPSTE
ncbi:MAG: hypothetical protein AAB449_02800 [Patescibacteria group bacterium]